MIYLAGSSKDKEYVRMIGEHIARSGIEVLSPWVNWTPQTHPNEEHNWRVLCSCITDAKATVVVAPPFGMVSQGSIFETGFTLGQRKPVHVLLRNSEDSLERVGHWALAPQVEAHRELSHLVSAISWTKGY